MHNFELTPKVRFIDSFETVRLHLVIMHPASLIRGLVLSTMRQPRVNYTGNTMDTYIYTSAYIRTHVRRYAHIRALTACLYSRSLLLN